MREPPVPFNICQKKTTHFKSFPLGKSLWLWVKRFGNYVDIFTYAMSNPICIF